MKQLPAGISLAVTGSWNVYEEHVFFPLSLTDKIVSGQGLVGWLIGWHSANSAGGIFPEKPRTHEIYFRDKKSE